MDHLLVPRPFERRQGATRMSMTPIHPALLLHRPLTEDEMMAALRYEGMFGLSEKYPEDLRTARRLAARGLLLLDEWDKGRGWHVCMLDKGDSTEAVSLNGLWCPTCVRRTDGLAYCLHCGTHQI